MPSTRVTTLDGTSVVLPDAFAHQPAVIVVGFSRKASEESRVWCRQLFASEQADGVENVFGVLMLSQVPRFLRGFVTNSIRSDITPKLRSHFLAVTEQEDAWRRLVDLRDPDDVYVVVVDAQGRVRWRQHGTYTMEGLQSVREALRQAQEK